MTALPPLASVRAFDAAARHLSFTRAAEELGITQSAVSRHMKQLEQFLGVLLFMRKSRNLALTPEGEKYQEGLSNIFQQMAAATAKIVNAVGEETFRIHTHATFATNWLIPRLQTFRRAHPEIDLHVVAPSRQQELDSDQEHAVIRIGYGDYEVVDKLFGVRLMPVCAPDYIDPIAEGSMSTFPPSATLIHSIAAPWQWRTWAHANGFDEDAFDRGHRFESSAMAILAALNGLGIAIAQPEFVSGLIERGALVTPFPEVVSDHRVYCLAFSKRFSRTTAARKFRAWMLREVGQ